MFKQYGKAMLALRELASFSVPKEQLAINDEQFNMKPIKLPVGPENLHTVKKRDKVKPEVTVSFDKVSPFEVACLYSPTLRCALKWGSKSWTLAYQCVMKLIPWLCTCGLILSPWVLIIYVGVFLCSLVCVICDPSFLTRVLVHMARALPQWLGSVHRNVISAVWAESFAQEQTHNIEGWGEGNLSNFNVTHASLDPPTLDPGMTAVLATMFMLWLGFGGTGEVRIVYVD